MAREVGPSLPTLAGSVHRHGVTRCEVLSLADPASAWASADENARWLVVCPHGSLCSHDDFDMAVWLAAHPREFCEEHR